MTIYPISIARSLSYLALYVFQAGREFDYTPPVGGYINNDQTEWDNTTWNDTVYLTKPDYTIDIVNNNDLGYAWRVQQDVTARFYSDESTAAKLYNGSTLQTNPILFTSSGTTASGSVIFQLTTNGLSTGTALFPNGINFMKAEISDNASSYNYTYTLSNSNKTLTVAVNSVALLLGLISFNTAANGKTVSVIVAGR